MSPIKRSFSRKSGFRDSKLLVVATEGIKTEIKYFNDIYNHFQNPRIHVEILKREDPTRSSPEDVIANLDKFNKEYSLESDDELWLVIDRDNWGDKKLSQVFRLAAQKEYYVALSNPNFELWLLLHLCDLVDYPEKDLKRFSESKSNLLKQELNRLLGEYNSVNLKTEIFIKSVEDAIRRAKALDQVPGDRWPQSLGTHVYKVVEKIISWSPSFSFFFLFS